MTFLIASEVSSYHTGSLNFKAEFPGCVLDEGIWRQTWNRTNMVITWSLPPELRERQLGVQMILNTQGYTPWHHPHPHWLRLQPRGAGTYGDHVLKDDKQNRVYGWRTVLATIHIGYQCSFPRKNADRLKTFGIKLGSDAT